MRNFADPASWGAVHGNGMLRMLKAKGAVHGNGMLRMLKAKVTTPELA